MTTLEAAFIDLSRRVVALEDALRVKRASRKTVSTKLELLLQQFCNSARASAKDIRSKRRFGYLVEQRWMFFAIARESGFGVTETARAAKKDHTTVVQGVKALNGRLEFDKNLRREFVAIKERMSRYALRDTTKLGIIVPEQEKESGHTPRCER